MNDYLSTVYSADRAPKTEYPQQLVRYLCQTFDLKPGQKLLEIGCGRGDFLRAFAESGLDCYGTDREKSAVQQSPAMKVTASDLEKEALPYADASFDVVYHKSVLEHFASPNRVMDETKRVLKPGGKCIILTPDWETCMPIFFEDITHIRPYNVTALRDTFQIWGMSKIDVKRIRQLPLLWKFPALVVFSNLIRGLFSIQAARALTAKTGINFFRWSVELMVMGYCEKPH